ncbi:hypothetical protein V2J09_018733 [Rumex salicifolius]
MCDTVRKRMKIKRGSKVEVFSTKEVPSGSWYPAEIIHGNGHYYTVKYDGVIGILGEKKFDRVPRRAIRPCPPVVQSLEDWASGQIAEVFHCFSWKMATILRVLKRHRLLVRLIGSSHGIEVSKIDIRPRLCWQHDQWKVIAKIPDNCEGTQASIWFKTSSFPVSNIKSIYETPTIPSQSLKRKLTIFHSSDALPSLKIRVIGKHSKQNQFISVQQFQLPEKVDAIASSRAMMVETCMPCFNNKLTGFSRSVLGREKVDDAVGCSRAMSLDFRGADSVDSSVASCSISRNNIRTGSFEHDECSSDAESFCQMESEDENSLVPAGPLSWEQESLLTNLRDSLHITNDEHLMEVSQINCKSSHGRGFCGMICLISSRILLPVWIVSSEAFGD